MLTGNLFRAAEASFSLKAGSVCSFSDENGLWSHGILMPDKTTLSNVLAIPVPLSSPEQVLPFIKAVATGRYGQEYLYLTDNLKPDAAKCMVRIRRFQNDWGFSVNFLGLKRNERSTLTSMPVLSDLASGKASRKSSKTGEGEILPIEQLDAVLPALLEGMNKIGAPLMIPGSLRPLFNEFLQDQLAGHAPTELARSIKAVEQRDEDLADLLDAVDQRPCLRRSA